MGSSSDEESEQDMPEPDQLETLVEYFEDVVLECARISLEKNPNPKVWLEDFR